MATDTLTAYTELGLAPGASEREAKAAWRRLVSQWHPDRNPGAAAVGRMQRLNQALDALRRAGFPQHGGPQPAAPGDRAQAPSHAPSRTPTEAPADPAAPPDNSAGPTGRPLRRQVRLTLEEAARGCTRVLSGKTSRLQHACNACSGAGWLQAAGDCATCHGAGVLRQPGWFGLFGAASTCTACAGTGQARQPCVACAGSGRQAPPGYRVSVRLPAGVRDGDTLAVAAHRMPRAGSPGELLIRVRVQPHALFTLDDDGTLHCSLPVIGWAWMANRTVPLAGLGGPLALQLDRTLHHHRLPGQGFPLRRGGAWGDLLVTVLPQFPAQLSTDQHILIDQLVATGL